jgi:transposase
MARYEAVMEQMRKGLSQAAVARSMNIDRRTIRRWGRARCFPERQVSARASMVDVHRHHLEQRWQEGCHNAAQLWRELRERGFEGQSAIVRNWVRRHFGSRRDRRQKNPVAAPPPRVSPRQTAWLLLKQPEDARPYLDALCLQSPEIANCASLAREFFRMIRQRDATAWPQWLENAKASPFVHFAKHLCKDQTAFLEALNQLWSNGQVEGQVHRLKLIKRSIYGRANFDLLRLRVVNAA